MLVQLQKDHPNDVSFTFRHFPLPNHPLSFKAATAAEAAGNQGKFWEYDEMLFANQGEWVTLSADQFNTYLVDHAKTLGLDAAKFETDMNSKEINDRIDGYEKRAEQVGIDHTPYLLLNGLPYSGPIDINSLESILGLFQLEKRQYSYCPPMIIDVKKQYIATLKTEKGDIQIQLFPDKAPLAVNSFVFLAKNGWFNNTTFHRVIQGFIAQAGDPSGSGYGGPGYTFKNEISTQTFEDPGLVGMANAGPDLNGSQFFITFGPAHNLDGSYTIFGQVISGMDVAQKLTLRDTQKDPSAAPGDKLISVTIQEK